MTAKIDRYDEDQHNIGPEDEFVFPEDEFDSDPPRVSSYLRERPFWTSKEGVVFERVEDIEDDHLMNLVPFISSRAHGLDMLMKNDLDEDQK
ncbi:hypothetical protein LCGC14_3037460, partial [marine sediment metagenome]